MLQAFTEKCRTPSALIRARILPSLDELQRQDIKEEEYLANYKQRVAAAREKSLGGRKSGTLDWRAQRQEVGLSGEMGGVSPRNPGKLASRCFWVISLTLNLVASVDPILDMTTGLTDLSLYGSADILPSSLDDDKLMLALTPLETDKTGSALLIPGIKASESYLLDVTFRIRKREGQDGADGMGLVFMAVPSGEVDSYREAKGDVRVIGDGSAGLGYTGSGTQDDFAVEFDTYRRSVCHFFPHDYRSSLPFIASIDVTIHQHRTSRFTSRRTRIIDSPKDVLRHIRFLISLMDDVMD